MPEGFVRNVFGNAEARGVLLFLARMDAPWRYAAVRDELAIHPQKFQRALQQLEHHALVGRRGGSPLDASGRRAVLLESTSLGRFWAEQWSAFQQQIKEAAKEQGILLEG